MDVRDRNTPKDRVINVSIGYAVNIIIRHGYEPGDTFLLEMVRRKLKY